jgi:galactose-1-phosphate uridylyltransferase
VDRALSVTDLSDADIAQFAEGLAKVLAGFDAMGFASFNLVLAGVAAGETSGHHRVTASVVPRFYVNPHSHACDVAYMQLCLDENFSMLAPEEVARRLRDHWR